MGFVSHGLFDACFLLLHKEGGISVHPARQGANLDSQGACAGPESQFGAELALESQLPVPEGPIFSPNTALGATQRAITPLLASHDVVSRVPDVMEPENRALLHTIAPNLQNRAGFNLSRSIPPGFGLHMPQDAILPPLLQGMAGCDRSPRLRAQNGEISSRNDTEKIFLGHYREHWTRLLDPGPVDRPMHLQRTSNAYARPNVGKQSLSFSEAALVQHTIDAPSRKDRNSVPECRRYEELAVGSQKRTIRTARSKKGAVTKTPVSGSFSTVASHASAKGIGPPNIQHWAPADTYYSTHGFTSTALKRPSRVAFQPPTLMLHVPDNDLKEEIVGRLRDKSFVQFVERLNRVLP